MMKLRFSTKKPAYAGILVSLTAILSLSLLVAVGLGSTSIPIEDVYGAICSGIKLWFGADASVEGPIMDVVWLIRMPRVILAIAVGGGLAVCGLVMQAVVRNPLADPYVLGVSSGASLGATLAILSGVGSVFGSQSIGVMAFIGALMASALVLFIANASPGSNMISGGGPIRLILAGMAVSAVFSAFSSFIIFVADDKDGIQSLTYWLMGSLGGAKWPVIILIHGVVAAGVVYFMSQFRTLDLMLLGDDVAMTLGKDLAPSRKTFMLVTALMVGFIVSGSGMIGFVGLIIPHVTRVFLGTGHLRNIPVAFLTGAIFVVWSDLASRIIIPYTELPIGILISMVGAPCFVYLLMTKHYGFGGNQ